MAVVCGQMVLYIALLDWAHDISGRLVASLEVARLEAMPIMPEARGKSFVLIRAYSCSVSRAENVDNVQSPVTQLTLKRS